MEHNAWVSSLPRSPPCILLHPLIGEDWAYIRACIRAYIRACSQQSILKCQGPQSRPNAQSRTPERADAPDQEQMGPFEDLGPLWSPYDGAPALVHLYRKNLDMSVVYTYMPSFPEPDMSCKQPQFGRSKNIDGAHGSKLCISTIQPSCSTTFRGGDL